jgi:arylsulfatase A-like enzyme
LVTGSLCTKRVSIPLLIKYPHQKHGLKLSNPVSQVDLLPTVLKALGFDPPKDIDGQCIRHTVEPKYVFSTSFPRKAEHKSLKRYERTVWAVFSGPMKLLSHGTGEIEFYDLSSDPVEGQNILAGNPRQSTRLQNALDHWLAVTAEYRGEVRKVDESVMERLKALGYVQ